jgi:hypothetical protein
LEGFFFAWRRAVACGSPRIRGWNVGSNAVSNLTAH